MFGVFTTEPEPLDLRRFYDSLIFTELIDVKKSSS